MGLLDLILGQGDPEAAGAVASSQAMQPATSAAGSVIASYLHDVLTGRIAADAARDMGSGYDPQRTFAQNATDPRGLANAMNVAMALGPGSIKAYHGSPHDFSKFDASKIGTGEGAQAYGHGLYFAENEGVARSYKPKNFLEGQLRHIQEIVKKETGLNATEDMAGSIWSAVHQVKSGAAPMGRAVNDALARDRDLRRLVAKDDPSYMTPFPTMERIVQQVSELPAPGRMYEVAIHANPEDFLQWDKPLSAQPKVIDRAPTIPIPEGRMPDAIGSEFYQRLVGINQSEYPGATKGYMPPPGFNASAMTSQQLLDRGIPGIRYLDQGSRGAGEGTANYVVFDPSIVEILRKYGLAGLLGGAGAVAASNPYTSTAQGSGP